MNDNIHIDSTIARSTIHTPPRKDTKFMKAIYQKKIQKLSGFGGA
jgi:hypothetical protein